MTLEIKKKRKLLVRRELAKKFWENSHPNASQLAEKYKVSESTGYRWIAEWIEEESH